MNDLKFYEKIPSGNTPVRIHFWDKLEKPPFRLHWHEHLEIHYILEGESVIECSHEIVTVKKGQCLIINSNELHYAVGGRSRYFCIILTPSFLPKDNVIFKRVIEDDTVSVLIEKMVKEYISGDELTEFTMMGYAHLILSELYKNHIYKKLEKLSLSAYSQRTVALNETIKYIHDNFMNELTLDSLAKRMFVTSEHLCRSFKEGTGKTVIEYINDLRIKKAKELLSSTDTTITEIAYMCGFNDSNYFSRKFKEITGLTPRRFRG